MLGHVNLGYSKLDEGVASLAAGSSTSGVGATPDVFPPANVWSIDQTTERVTAGFTGGLDLGGNSIQNVSAILSPS